MMASTSLLAPLRKPLQKHGPAALSRCRKFCRSEGVAIWDSPSHCYLSTLENSCGKLASCAAALQFGTSETIAERGLVCKVATCVVANEIALYI
jgi:hypothetical protein